MSIIVDLDHVLTHDNKMLAQLELHRLSVGDMLFAAKNATFKEEIGFLLLALSARLPPEALISLDLADFIKVQARLIEFLGVPVPGFGAE